MNGRKGAELLEIAGISKDFCNLIRYHGKYIKEPSRDQELMWLADLCINGKGEYVTFSKDDLENGYHRAEFDISVSAEKNNPYSRIAQNQTLTEL